MVQTRPDPIAQPVLNTPYEHPARHWKLDETGRALPEVIPGRRPSIGLIPVPKASKKAAQGELVLDEGNLNEVVNSIRHEVSLWRDRDYPGVTKATRNLLYHWREKRTRVPLFFAQREAAETMIWFTETTRADHALRRRIEEESSSHNDGIMRLAIKMATGTGKTTVMGMIIAWHAVNAARSSRRDRYSRSFLVITPGHTVRERLAVLSPSHPENIYRDMGLIPEKYRRDLRGIDIAIVNFQAFQRRRLLAGVAGDARKLLASAKEAGDQEEWEDAPAMLDRVLRSLRGKRRLVVLNDEAHHCYLPGAGRSGAGGKEDDKVAAVWFNALRSLRDSGRLGPVYDLSATPMFISATHWKTGSRIFPWVVSDFPLMDAIESGLVKIPRLPLDDDTVMNEVVWRSIYKHSGRKTVKPDQVPPTLGAAMDALYRHYEQTFRRWRENGIPTPPVFIVVANSVPNAEALFKYIAGYEYTEETTGNLAYIPGELRRFSNIRDDGAGYEEEVRTILVHSKLDRDDNITGRLQTLAKSQARRFSNNGADWKDVIRQVLNTVGRKGEPGEHIRCVVSVSMLTEGWDTRTVTHILGYRAFSTQLLCEQVTGRALRRLNYDDTDDEGRLRPEFAEVFGVPFDFMPAGGETDPRPPRQPYRVHSLSGRSDLRIVFPLVTGYLLEPAETRLELDPSLIPPYDVEVTESPTVALSAGVTGEETVMGVATRRRQQAVMSTAAAAVSLMVKRGNGLRRRTLFRDMVRATEDWLASAQVQCRDESLLLQPPHVENVPNEIIKACSLNSGRARLVGSFDLEVLSDTAAVDFDTSLPNNRLTRRSELNIAACHSSFEVEMAGFLDSHKHVSAWARNFRLGWTVPYLWNSVWHDYEPDFIVRLFDEREGDQAVHLMVECKGVPDEVSERKAQYVREWWIPAVANSPEIPRWLSRWCFVELDHPDQSRYDLDKAISQAAAAFEIGGS